MCVAYATELSGSNCDSFSMSTEEILRSPQKSKTRPNQNLAVHQTGCHSRQTSSSLGQTQGLRNGGGAKWWWHTHAF